MQELGRVGPIEGEVAILETLDCNLMQLPLKGSNRLNRLRGQDAFIGIGDRKWIFPNIFEQNGKL
jgi:hypothetical protein